MPEKLENRFLSIVMPVYKEESIIGRSVQDYHDKVLSKFSKWEFIIVYDPSPDNTLSVLKKLKEKINITIIENETRLGHGTSLMKAYRAAKGEIVFYTDSDYQNEPSDFWKLYENIDKNDLIIGYRSGRKDPLHRIVLTTFLRSMIFLLYRVYVADANSPFRIIKRTLLDKFLANTDDSILIPSIVMSIYAKKNKYNVEQIPVKHYARIAGKSAILRWGLVKLCVKAFFQLIAYNFRGDPKLAS